MAEKPNKDLLDGLDAELAKGVEASETGKEKAKRDRTKTARKVSISIGTYRKLAAAPYEFLAIWLGDHWRLEEWEARDAGQALKEMMDALGPEWLMKWFPAIAYAVINLEIIARKGKLHKEIKDREKKVKAEAEAEAKFLPSPEPEPPEPPVKPGRDHHGPAKKTEKKEAKTDEGKGKRRGK